MEVTDALYFILQSEETLSRFLQGLRIAINFFHDIRKCAYWSKDDVLVLPVLH